MIVATLALTLLAGAAVALALHYRAEGRLIVDAAELELEQVTEAHGIELAGAQHCERAAVAAARALESERAELVAELEQTTLMHGEALLELEAVRDVAAGDSLEQAIGQEVAVHTARPDDQSWSGVLVKRSGTHLHLAGAVHAEKGPAGGTLLVPLTLKPTVQVLGESERAVEM